MGRTPITCDMGIKSNHRQRDTVIAVPRKRKLPEDFYERVWEVAKCIPFGMVTTYGAIGKALGLARSARMVGYAMNATPDRQGIPAHRVVNRNGELSGKLHFETPELMRELLESEGIEFLGSAVNLDKHLWTPDVDLF